MASETLITTANILQIFVPILSLVAYVPQWRQLIKTKSSGDISIHAWIIWCLSSAFALFYAIVQFHATGSGMALVFSTITSLLFMLVTTYMVFTYRRRPSLT